MTKALLGTGFAAALGTILLYSLGATGYWLPVLLGTGGSAWLILVVGVRRARRLPADLDALLENNPSPSQLKAWLAGSLIEPAAARPEMNAGGMLLLLVVVVLAYCWVPWSPTSLVGQVARFLGYVFGALMLLLPISERFDQLISAVYSQVKDRIKSSRNDACRAVASDWGYAPADPEPVASAIVRAGHERLAGEWRTRIATREPPQDREAPSCRSYPNPIEYGPPERENDRTSVLPRTERGNGRIAVSPDGRFVLWQIPEEGGDVLRIIDRETGTCERKLTGLPELTHAIASPPASPLVAFGGFKDKRTRIFLGPPDWTFVGFLPEAGDSVYCVAFSSDALRCATGHGDGIVRLWDLTSMTLIAQSKKVMTSVKCCAFVGPNVVYGSAAEGLLILWEMKPNQTVSLKEGAWSIEQLAVNETGTLVAFSDYKGALQVFTRGGRVYGSWELGKAKSLFFRGGTLFTLLERGLFASERRGDAFSTPVITLKPGPDRWFREAQPVFDSDAIVLRRTTKQGEDDYLDQIVVSEI